MKKTIRILSIVVAVVMLVMTFTACSTVVEDETTIVPCEFCDPNLVPIENIETTTVYGGYMGTYSTLSITHTIHENCSNCGREVNSYTEEHYSSKGPTGAFGARTCDGCHRTYGAQVMN